MEGGVSSCLPTRCCWTAHSRLTLRPQPFSVLACLPLGQHCLLSWVPSPSSSLRTAPGCRVSWPRPREGARACTRSRPGAVVGLLRCPFPPGGVGLPCP